MTPVELLLGTMIGIILLISIIAIITAIVIKANSKKIDTMKNVYIVKLANSETSIQNAMNYLELTNSIMNYKDN